MDYLDKMHEGLKNLLMVRAELIVLAEAFDMVGNEAMATKLHDLGLVVMESHNDINNAYSEQMDESLEASQQASVNVLNATLAGVELTKKENEV